MAKHHHRHRVRNPFSVKGLTGSLSRDLAPAAVGGAGAVGLDILMAYLPLPATFQTGMMNYLALIAGSLGLGWAAGKVAGPRNGQLVTIGALTVTGYKIIRSIASTTLGANIKGLSGLADFKDYSALGRMGAYMEPGRQMGAGMAPRLGAYMNPGAMLRPGTMLAAPNIRGRQAQMGAYMRNLQYRNAGGVYANAA